MKVVHVCFIVLVTPFLLGFQPFHFTTDPVGSGFTATVGGTSDWTQSGSILTCGTTNTEHILVRDTDTSDDMTVESRSRRVGDSEYGPGANRQDDTNYYLWYAWTSSAKFALFVRTTGGGFSEVCGYGVSPADSTWYNMKITTQTDGSNKILNAYLDGILRCGPVTTATKMVNGDAMYRTLPYGGPVGKSEHEWFAFDLSLGATSIDPTLGRHSGGEAVTVTGTSFGDEMQLDFDSTAATGVASEPTTIITATTPENSSEPCDVIVGFGTAGSYEYAVTITNGWTYRLMGGLGTTGGGL